ncbi:hypothetical protein [Dasania marina]|uniref:hypothetical protein n=1 Tax=Dasania marina TaxID=471499 RepID=UPI0030DA9F0E|tara:strand:- start:2890 stop:3789 length:900 start_codon:yes stop_codon:yes gene_type:complete
MSFFQSIKLSLTPLSEYTKRLESGYESCVSTAYEDCTDNVRSIVRPFRDSFYRWAAEGKKQGLTIANTSYLALQEVYTKLESEMTEEDKQQSHEYLLNCAFNYYRYGEWAFGVDGEPKYPAKPMSAYWKSLYEERQTLYKESEASEAECVSFRFPFVDMDKAWNELLRTKDHPVALAIGLALQDTANKYGDRRNVAAYELVEMLGIPIKDVMFWLVTLSQHGLLTQGNSGLDLPFKYKNESGWFLHGAIFQPTGEQSKQGVKSDFVRDFIPALTAIEAGTHKGWAFLFPNHCLGNLSRT